MAFTWKEIESDPEFQKLPYEQRRLIQDDFFVQMIAPSVPKEEMDAAYQEFYRLTEQAQDDNVERFGERVGLRAGEALSGIAMDTGRKLTGDFTPHETLGLGLNAVPGMVGKALWNRAFPPREPDAPAGEATINDVLRAPGEVIEQAGTRAAGYYKDKLDKVGDYGIRRPDSIMQEPLQAGQFYGTQILESFFSNMLPSMAAGVAAGPVAGLGTLAAGVYGEEYANQVLSGADEMTAAKVAMFRSAAETIPEMLPFGILFSKNVKFLGPAFSKAQKVAPKTTKITAASIAEGISEDVTEIANFLYDKYELGEDLTREDFFKRMKDAFVTGVGMGVGMGGAVVGLESFMNREKLDDLTFDLEEFARRYYGEAPLLEGRPDLQDPNAGFDLRTGRSMPGPFMLERPSTIHVNPEGVAGVGIDLTAPRKEPGITEVRNPQVARGPGTPAGQQIPRGGETIYGRQGYGIPPPGVAGSTAGGEIPMPPRFPPGPPGGIAGETAGGGELPPLPPVQPPPLPPSEPPAPAEGGGGGGGTATAEDLTEEDYDNLLDESFGEDAGATDQGGQVAPGGAADQGELTRINDMGVRVADAKVAKGVDAGIADVLDAVNDAGYATVQSASGLDLDYPTPERRSNGGGYLAFWKKDLTEQQEKDIIAAAEKTGIVVDPNADIFLAPAITVRPAPADLYARKERVQEEAGKQAAEELGLPYEMGPSVAFPSKQTVQTADWPRGMFNKWLERRDAIMAERKATHKDVYVLNDAQVNRKWDDFVEALTGKPLARTIDVGDIAPKAQEETQDEARDQEGNVSREEAGSGREPGQTDRGEDAVREGEQSPEGVEPDGAGLGPEELAPGTQAEGEGVTSPEPAAETEEAEEEAAEPPREYADLTSYDKRLVLARTEELRSAVEDAGLTSAERYLHEAVGNIIEDELNQAETRVRMAADVVESKGENLDNVHKALINLSSTIAKEAYKKEPPTPPAEPPAEPPTEPQPPKEPATEEPAAGAKEEEDKRGRKLDDEGKEITRWWDQQAEAKSPGKQIWDAVLARTNRTRVFSPTIPADATPGTQRWIDELRSTLFTFADVVQQADPLGVGERRYNVSSYSKSLAEVMIDKLEDPQNGEEFRKTLFNVAKQYELMMKQFSDQFDGARTIRGAMNKLQAYFAPGTINPAKWGTTSLTVAMDIVPRMAAVRIHAKRSPTSVFKDEYILPFPHNVQGWSIPPRYKRQLADLIALMEGQNAKGEYVQGSTLKELMASETQAENPSQKKKLIRPKIDYLRESEKQQREGDVTPLQFKERFGFMAGKIFGHWVNAKEDQAKLNAAWDAFSDLADRIGVPYKAIGFFSRMYFVIGKVGSGKASAHFHAAHRSRDGSYVKLINITKTRGDGTLAHEWGHAFDHFVLGMQTNFNEHAQGASPEAKAAAKRIQKRMYDALRMNRDIEVVKRDVELAVRGQSWMPVSIYGPKGSEKNVRAVAEYWRRNMRPTQFKKDADALGKKYWGSPEEMFARAWEAFIYDTLDGKNNFLVSSWVKEAGVTKEHGYRGRPYPIGEERVRFNAYFEALIKSIKIENDMVLVDEAEFDAHLDDPFDRQYNELLEAIPSMIAEEQKRKEEEQRLIAEQMAEKKKAREKAEQEAAAESARKALEEARAALGIEEETEQPAENTERDLTDADYDAILDEAFDANDAEEAEHGKPQDVPDSDAAKAKAAAAEMAKNGIEGMEEILLGIAAAMRGKPKPPGSPGTQSGMVQFPNGVDPDRYATVKPHFDAALEKFRAAGQNLRDFVNYFSKVVSDYFEFSLKPYLKHYMMEKGLRMDLSSRYDDESTSTTHDKPEDGSIGAQDSLANILFNRFDDITDRAALKTVLREHYGREIGPDEVKAGEEAYEMALVAKARAIVGKGNSQRVTYEELLALYEKMPSLITRTSTSIENQAYSTPVPLAYMASLLAGIDKSKTVYEPSAGNGMLLIGAAQDNATVNELNATRAKNMRDLGFQHVRVNDAVNWRPSGAFDSVIMNPPFGGLDYEINVDGYRIKKIDHAIAAKALEAMADDGKAVLILGANMQAGEKIVGFTKTFYNWLYSHYNVTDHFEVDGALYRKQGASWPVAVITIEGRRLTNKYFDATPPRIKSWAGVYERANAILDSRRSVSDGRDVGGAVDTGAGAEQPGGTPGTVEGSAGATDQGPGRGGGGGSAEGAGGGSDTADAGRTGDTGGSGGGAAGGGRTGVDTGAEGTPGSERVPDGGTRTDVRGKDRKAASVAADGELQVPYIPHSRGTNENVLVPVNMRDAMDSALAEIERKVGNLDDYVREKLGYSSNEEMWDVMFALQVDAIAASIYNLENLDQGIIIADQTGVGKGRQAAGMIRYALKNGMTPVFVTKTENLFTDMYDDLLDINHSDIRPFIMNAGSGVLDSENTTYKQVVDEETGDIDTVVDKPAYRVNRQTAAARQKGFKTLSAGSLPLVKLPGERKAAPANMVFLTYSQIDSSETHAKEGKVTVRDALDGFNKHHDRRLMVILDEAHNMAGPAMEIKKGEPRLKGAGWVQQWIENAKTLYLSATFAKRPDNMAAFFKTSLFDAVEDRQQLIEGVTAGGEPLQTVIANMLARAGQLFRRERSFDGIDTHRVEYKDNRKRDVYKADQITTGLRELVGVDEMFANWAKDNMEYLLQKLGEGGGTVTSAGGKSDKTIEHSPFASIVHNYIKQFLLALKVDEVVNEAVKSHQAGEKPVIALEYTMQSFLDKLIERDMAEVGKQFEGDFRTVLDVGIERTRRVTVKNPQGYNVKYEIPLDWLPSFIQAAYNRAHDVVGSLDIADVPIFPLDYMQQQLRSKGLRVDELTGRTMVTDYQADGTMIVKTRPASSKAAKRMIVDKFNKDQVDVLFLNASGSTGLSIHNAVKFFDMYKVKSKRRHMIVAQPMGDINTMMQAFGRINRTGQDPAKDKMPRYTIATLSLAAEERPTAMMMIKLRSLNANTSANTDSVMTFESDALFNKYGDEVVRDIIADDPDLSKWTRISVERDKAPPTDLAKKFTGKLAILPNEVQDRVWEQIIENYKAKIAYLDEMGLNELRAEYKDMNARIVSNRIFIKGPKPETRFGGHAILHKVMIRLQGKPPSPAEMLQARDKGLNGRTGDELSKEFIDNLRKASTEEADLQSRIDDLKENIKKLREANDNKPIESIKGTKGIREELEALEGRLAGFRRMVQDVEYHLQRYRVGDAVKLDIGEKDYVTAVITGIEHHYVAGKGSPYAPGKIIYKMMMAHPHAHRSLPLSQLLGTNVIAQKINFYNVQQIQRLFEAAVLQFRGGYEQKYLITGNLIIANSALKQAGVAGAKTITFTGANGKVYPAIELPANFDPAKTDTTADIVIKEPVHGVAYFKALIANGWRYSSELSLGIYNRTQSVRLSANRYGDYTLSVPKKNDQTSNEIKFDKKLRDLIGDFAGSTSRLYVKFKEDKAGEVITRLMQIQNFYAPESMQTLMDQITGNKTEDYETKYTFDDGVNEPVLEWQGQDKAQEIDGEIPDFKMPEITRIAKAWNIYRPFFKTTWRPLRNPEALEILVRGVRAAFKRDGIDMPDDAIELVSPSLAQAKAVAALERLFEKKIVFFRPKGFELQGASPAFSSKYVFVNVNTPNWVQAIAGHELFHQIETEHPELLQRILKLLEGNADIEGYAKAYRQGDEQARREIVSDLAGMVLSNENTLKALSTDPRTFREFLERAVEYLARLLDRIMRRGLKASQFFKDMKAAEEAMIDVLRDYQQRKAGVEPEPPTTRQKGEPSDLRVGAARRLRDAVSAGLESVWSNRAERLYQKGAAKLGGWYNPMSMLPGVQEYLIKRYLALGRIGQIEQLTDRIYAAFEEADTADKAAVYEYFTTKNGIATTIRNAAVRRNAVKAKDIINRISTDLAARGMLPQEVVEENYDQYLPRLYLKYLMEPKAWYDLGLGNKVSGLGYLKKRKDIDRDIREVVLGQIKDPGFLASVAVGRTLRDMAILDFLEQVSTNTQWVHPEYLVDFNGRRVTIFYLEAEAKRLQRQSYRAQDQQIAQRMRVLADQMMQAVAAQEAAVGGLDTTDYRQIPNTPQYGKLRGMWVRKEIRDDVVGIGGTRAQGGKAVQFLEGAVGVGGWGTWITQWWKIFKVPLNPPTQARNFTSNMILLNLSGVPMHRIPALLVRASSQMRANGRAWQIAKKYGVTKSTFSSQELRRVHRHLTELQAEMATNNTYKVGLILKSLFEALADKGSDIYQVVESLGKTAKIIDMLDRGAGEATAALEAHKWLFDYSLVPNSVRWFRNAPVGMPFITFYYKALPRMLETAMMYPWRFVPYVALPYAIMQGLAYLWDVDDEDLEKLKMALPQWLQNKQHVYLLPYMTEDGRWDAFDFSYFLPWTMFLDTLENTMKGDVQEMFKETGMFGGPISQLIIALRSNEDPFTGKDITGPHDTNAESAVAWGKYLLNMALPTWLTERGMVGKFFEMYKGTNIDSEGRVKFPWWHAALRGVGANMYRIDPQQSREINMRRMQRNLQDMQFEMGRQMREPGLTEEDLQEIYLDWQVKMERQLTELAEYEQASQINPKLRKSATRPQ